MVGQYRGYDRRTFLKAAGAAGSATALSGLAGAREEERGDGRQQFVVGVSSPFDLDAVAEYLPSNVRAVFRETALGFLLVEIDVGSTYGQLATEAAILDVPGVKYVEPNVEYGLLDAPGGSDADPETDDPRFDDQYAPQMVDAPEARESVSARDEVTVAVVDQGVNYDHPDLTAQFDENVGEDFFLFDEPDPAPKPVQEPHGTHVAGIAAATPGNDEGIAGVSDATLLSVRVIGASVTNVAAAFAEMVPGDTLGGGLADTAAGIRYAADQGAGVINLSFGGNYTKTIDNAVKYAADSGSLLVAAAGNDGDPLHSDSTVRYPAALDECVAVSALDRDGNLADFSSRGPEVDLAAPGVDVLSTTTGGGYARNSGTSLSCPVVSGVAALVKAEHPELDADALRARLKTTARDLGLPSEKQGAGRVDAARAVAGTACNTSVERTERTGTLSSGNEDAFSYAPATGTPCQVTIGLSGDAEADLDLFVTLDGRPPTEADHDRASRTPRTDERVVLPRDALDGSDLGIAVHSYSGQSAYTLTIREWAAPLSARVRVEGAGIDAVPGAAVGDVNPDQTLTFSAAESRGGPTGYEWAFGDGTTATGPRVDHVYGESGTYEVTLTVTGPDGTTDTETIDVTVDPWWKVW